jgi:hypothetical protein
MRSKTRASRPSSSSRPQTPARLAASGVGSIRTVEPPGSAGAYRLVKRLGGGNFGDVWLSHAPGNFPVAVKVIHRHLEDARPSAS